MRSRIWGASAGSCIAGALAVAGFGPAFAQSGAQSGARQQQQPVTDRSPDAGRVAETPLRDLNLKKDGIPPVLQAAARDPYATDGLTSCTAVSAAVRELDVLLGPDFDLGEAQRNGVTPGKVAESVVGSLIPFRGLIREASGAASAERQLQVAIFAGATRRGFLKGLGVQRGCNWPAGPATLQQPVALRK
ncbi:MAG: hypothetical protein K2Y17_07805 [Qipengyuania sp.]|nr:hypothetical protein [Qipengyuania sp.]